MKDKSFSAVIVTVGLIVLGFTFLFCGSDLPEEAPPEGYMGEPVQYISFDEEMIIEANVTHLDFSEEEPMVITIEEVENFKEE